MLTHLSKRKILFQQQYDGVAHGHFSGKSNYSRICHQEIVNSLYSLVCHPLMKTNAVEFRHIATATVLKLEDRFSQAQTIPNVHTKSQGVMLTSKK